MEIRKEVLAVSKGYLLLLSSFLSAFALGLSTQVKFYLPFTPVPITLQTFVLLSCAAILRRQYAVFMVLWYIVLGLFGMPFFAGGAGIDILRGVTGGYIWGFAVSAAFLGYVDIRSAGILRALLYFLVAAMLLYIPGLIQLKIVMHVSWLESLRLGLYPFIMGDIVKASAAACLVKSSYKIFGSLSL